MQVRGAAGRVPVARTLSFDAKLATIEACAEKAALDTERSLLHAFVGCLSPAEVCRGLIQTLGKPTILGLAFRNRLQRMAADGAALEEIDALGNELLRMISSDALSNLRRDAHLSQLFPLLAPPTRRATLERWVDLDTKGARKRWLKAVVNDPMFFSVDEMIAYWRRTVDPSAAWVIAKHATPDSLSYLLPELITASAPGWVVSKAALRATSVSAETWNSMRQDLPATYIYLCAKMKRHITDDEAMEIAEACDPLDDQGLAIWAVGQLGKWNVLEKLKRTMDRTAEQRALIPVSRLVD